MVDPTENSKWKQENTSFLANQIGPIYCDPRITRNKEKGKESKKKKKLAFVFGCKDEKKEKRGNASYTFIILN